MKYIIVLLLSVFWFSSNIAQDTNRNKKFSGGFEFRYLKTFDVGVDNLTGGSADFPGAYGKSLRFNIGWFLNSHVYSGLCFGADRYEVAAANTFPLTVNCRYYFKDAPNTLYTFIEGGPIISFSSASDNGYTGALGLGYKFFISKRACLAATLGYNYQRSKLEGLNAVYYGDYLSRKSILFGIGMHF